MPAEEKVYMSIINHYGLADLDLEFIGKKIVEITRLKDEVMTNALLLVNGLFREHEPLFEIGEDLRDINGEEKKKMLLVLEAIKGI